MREKRRIGFPQEKTIQLLKISGFRVKGSCQQELIIARRSSIFGADVDVTED